MPTLGQHGSVAVSSMLSPVSPFQIQPCHCKQLTINKTAVRAFRRADWQYEYARMVTTILLLLLLLRSGNVGVGGRAARRMRFGARYVRVNAIVKALVRAKIVSNFSTIIRFL